jgi:hypothetical protein
MADTPLSAGSEEFEDVEELSGTDDEGSPTLETSAADNTPRGKVRCSITPSTPAPAHLIFLLWVACTDQ